MTDRTTRLRELDPGPGPCAHCGEAATCFGVYEHSENPVERACDTCCGHGNEDGWCERIDNVAALAKLLKEAGAQPTLYGKPVDLLAVRDRLAAGFDAVLTLDAAPPPALPDALLDEIERLANAATQGWRRAGNVETNNVYVRHDEGVSALGRVLATLNHHFEHTADAAFIAALDPDTVRALVSAARGGREQLRAVARKRWDDALWQLRQLAEHGPDDETRARARDAFECLTGESV